eukprot:TRINITY_DN30385_c0_g1_i1.p1 TRINITY_DN30385_c0_g1~~TRINITY_DN30385_c0_g1_i1.p1  ORF type:complete len:392 (+),score=71.90 TRINITY_DN30385_c0_g1_i1:53-1228(+)
MSKLKGFLFSSVPNILCELGSSTKVGELMKGLGSKHAMIVTDQGLRKLGLTDKIQEGIESQGIKCSIYDKVAEDPPESIVLELIQQCKENGVDGVVGVGGGSSMDTAKLTAFMAGDTKQSIQEVYGVGKTVGRRLPLVQVPTTAGTGSEVTDISVITTGVAEKKGVVGGQLYADYAVLDGDLTLSLPPKVSAATGIDAMVHAIEAYTSKFKKNVLSDVLAREALKLLSENIRLVCEDGQNREARGGMLLGSLYAGMAFANSPCAAVHALAYPIGSHFHVPHGLSNSLMLPHVLRFNKGEPKAAEMYKDLTPIVFPKEAGLKGTDVSVMADGFSQLSLDLNIPVNLGQVGIQEKDLEFLASEAMKVDRLMPNNPREVKLQDALDLYTQAYNN